MGGGGVMKAAAKAAGIGAVTAGFSGDNPVFSAARQIPSVFSSSSSADVALQEKRGHVAGLERVEELGDWELAGDERSVAAFGGAPPTVQEARDATSELKDALEKAFLSSPSTPAWGLSLLAAHDSNFSMRFNTKIIDCFTSPDVPKNALKAFTLFCGSDVAQTIVASIACDPNVWIAVMQNEALVDFLQSSNPLSETCGPKAKILHRYSDSQQPPREGKGFKLSLDSIKTRVVDMVSNLSEYFNYLFIVPREEKPSPEVVNEDVVDFEDIAKLMGLAVMVIAIIFMKRE